MSESIERRLSAAAIVAATATFGLLLVLLPSYFPTFDEAKYLGIGVDIWSGHGITTVFGAVFTSHAPAWPAIIALPQKLFGIDPLAVGRVLDAICGIAFVILTGALGWRVRPIVGAISAAGLLALVYLHDLTRTARLDVPAATLTLLYLFVAFVAFRRGSIRLGIAAGLVFAAGFLVKEIDLPFAPAPLLAATLWGVPWRSLARTGAALLGVAAVGIAPWFVFYAVKLHLVYRLDAPGWTLVPIAIGLLVTVVVAASAERIAEHAVGARISRLAGRLGPDARLRKIIGWGLTLAWSALLTYVFAKTARLTGTAFLGLDQLRLYAATWFDALRTVAIFGLAGVVLAVVALIVDPAVAAARGIRDCLIVTICGIPLILLVIAVGEPPRNYLANLAIITVLAAAGWVWALERLLRTSRTFLLVGGAGLLGGAGGVVLAGLASGYSLIFGPAGVVVGAGAAGLALALERRGVEVRPFIVPAVSLFVLVGGAGLLVGHGRNSLNRAGDVARNQAVSTEVAWIRANIPHGTKIAYGSFLAYETAYYLAADYGTTEIRARIAVSSAAAPDGLLRVGESPAGDDWIAVDSAPRNVDQFQAYRASWLTSSFKSTAAMYWVYTTGIDTSSPTIEAALSSATGFTKVVEWTFPVKGAPPLHTSIYRIDPSAISFDTSRLVFAPDALERLADLLGEDGPAGRDAAARLLSQVDVEPPGPDADAALTTLKGLAGQ
jgi:4-amino-4-deoxy-L-arabinose transferase-like glycosyltransferase